MPSFGSYVRSKRLYFPLSSQLCYRGVLSSEDTHDDPYFCSVTVHDALARRLRRASWERQVISALCSAKSQKITTAIFPQRHRSRRPSPATCRAIWSRQATGATGTASSRSISSSTSSLPTQHQVNQVVNYLQSFWHQRRRKRSMPIASPSSPPAPPDQSQSGLCADHAAPKYQAGSTTLSQPVDAADHPARASRATRSSRSPASATEASASTPTAPARRRPNRKKAILPVNNTSTGVPGSFTVGDAPGFYQVNALYKLGIDGTGSTIGIATLADFQKSDATTYWKQIGLNVTRDRTSKVSAVLGGLDRGRSGQRRDHPRRPAVRRPRAGRRHRQRRRAADRRRLHRALLQGGLRQPRPGFALDQAWGGSEVGYFNSGLTGGRISPRR